MPQFDLKVLRRVLPTAAIAAAVIYGLHGTLIEPDASELSKVNATLVQARDRHAASLVLQKLGGDLQANVDDFKLHLADVRRRALAATDQRELFERISNFAHEVGIDVEQVRSLDWKPKTDSTGGSAGQADGSACTLTLSGPYASLCGFVGKVEKELGFAAITRLRVQPVAEGPFVHAEIDLTCFAPPLSSGGGTLASGGNQ